MENWKDIHPDFAREWVNGITYQQKWEEYNLTYQDAQILIPAGFEPKDYYKVKTWKNHNLTTQEVKTWIDIGLKTSEYEFVAYLKYKNIQPNSNLNLKELKAEFNSWLENPKPAQEYLDAIFPKSQRNTIKELNLSKKNLAGSLDLSDFVNLEKLYCYQNNLTSLKLEGSGNLGGLHCENNNLQDLAIFSELEDLEWLDISNNPITDSLKPLENLRKLWGLNISDTDIDSGLEYLPESVKNFRCLADIRKDVKCKAIYDLFADDQGEVETDDGWIKNFPKKLKEYKCFAEYLKLKDYELNQNLTELRNKYQNSLEKQKTLQERLQGKEIDNITLHQRWKNSNKKLIAKLNQAKLQDQIKSLEVEKQRLEELNQKLAQRIPFLEKQIEESEYLIKEQKGKIVNSYLSSFTEEEKEALEELIKVHKSYLEVKKQRISSSKLKEKYDKLYYQLREKLGKDFIEVIEVILTNFEELYQREWDLQKQLKEKEQNIETKIFLENQQKEIQNLLQEAQKNMSLIMEQEFQAKLQQFQDQHLKLTEKQSQLITETVINKIEEIVEDSDRILSVTEKPILEKEIGKGGYGEVYQGKWESREVAIKKLILSDDAQRKEIRDEINTLKKLKDRNIIQYYGVYYKDKEILIIMDYAENGTLKEFINSIKDQDWNLNAEIIKQMVSGLKYIHHKDIVHCDLKSLNVLMTAGNQAKISDFGLSKLSYLQSGDLKGSLRWMAPELLKGQKYSEQSDIYALGMIMWEIASKNTLPFKDMNDISAYSRIKNGRKETIPSDTPQNIKDIIQGCWKDNPSKRISLNDINEGLGYQIVKVSDSNILEQSPQFQNSSKEVSKENKETSNEISKVGEFNMSGLNEALGEITEQQPQIIQQQPFASSSKNN